MILVVEYISELTIYSVHVHPFCVEEMYNTSFIHVIMKLKQKMVQLVLKNDLDIILLSYKFYTAL